MAQDRNFPLPRLADSLTPEMLDLTRGLSRDIREIIDSAPGGAITFGQFAGLSMEGTPDSPGYYSNPSFAPNNSSSAGGAFNTIALLDVFGKSIGERAISQLLKPVSEAPRGLRLVEFGGGDGRLMRQFLEGITPTLEDRGIMRIETLSVDNTPQLLERQELTVSRHTYEMRRSGFNIYSAFVLDSVTSYANSSNRTGIVFSNELLDMLPFEVPLADGKILCVKNGKDGFEYTEQEPPEPLIDILNKHPQDKGNGPRIVQPELVAAMETMCRQVGKGILLTMDYRPGDTSRVQLMRGGVSLDPFDELSYPGLIDISVKPDWDAVARWASSKPNLKELSRGNINDLTEGSPFKDKEAAIEQLHKLFLSENPNHNSVMTPEQRRGYIKRYTVLMHNFWHIMFRIEAPN